MSAVLSVLPQRGRPGWWGLRAAGGAALKSVWRDGGSRLRVCGLSHLPIVSGLLSKNYQIKNLNPN